MTIIDKNENKGFHPSVDIQDNVLVLGFRIRKEGEKETEKRRRPVQGPRASKEWGC